MGLTKDIFFKQWPLVQNSQDSLITRANLARRVTFFSKMAFGKCRRVWRVLATRLGECQRVWQVLATRLGECWQVWQVLAKVLGECRRIWRVLAKPWQMLAHDKIGRFKQK